LGFDKLTIKKLMVQQHLSNLYTIPNWEFDGGHHNINGPYPAFPYCVQLNN